METIKGLIAVLLAAVVVFFAVLFYNNNTVPAYEARIIQANMANAVKNTKQTAIGTKTNAVTHQKIKNSNLRG